MSDASPVHVLVIDDSAVVRHTVTRLLRPQDGWRLTVAPDPIVGLERIRVDPPDVILLDLEMPRMDGLTFLRHLMATKPIPVVLCSGYAEHGTRLALSALETGAVEIFPKPRLAVKKFLQESAPSLASVLRRAAQAAPSLRRGWRPDVRPEGPFGNGPAAGIAAGSASPRAGPRAGEGGAPAPTPRQPASREPTGAAPRGAGGAPRSWRRTVLLGASMGGPQAIRHILTEFPANGPGCLIVQHMPQGFTAEFARRLDRTVAMEVREAEDGDRVVEGRALVAPGGRHLAVEAGPGRPVVRVTDTDPVHGHRPSVDVLFRSAAGALGPDVVAAILTGMGEDGADGLRALADAGARTLVQDRASSVVYGMPGAALDRGAGERTVSLRRMAPVLLELAAQDTPAPTSSGAPA